mmetsp:Transcript_33134/g.69356  ORF Transcript_33134/g.69356 Transcript_33134/m.69356 type:complete len:90 (+) Transcript_33134:572-841(+)
MLNLFRLKTDSYFRCGMCISFDPIPFLNMRQVSATRTLAWDSCHCAQALPCNQLDKKKMENSRTQSCGSGIQLHLIRYLAPYSVPGLLE